MQSANPSNHPIAPTALHSSNGRDSRQGGIREREAFKAVSKLKNKVSEMTGANHNRNGAKNCAQKKKYCLVPSPACSQKLRCNSSLL